MLTEINRLFVTIVIWLPTNLGLTSMPNDSLNQVLMTHKLLKKMYKFCCPSQYIAVS